MFDIGWHISLPENRTSIEQQGLLARDPGVGSKGSTGFFDDYPELRVTGVYLMAFEPQWTEQMRTEENIAHSLGFLGYDVWKIDLRGLDYQDDPSIHHDYYREHRKLFANVGRFVIVPHDIQPARVSLAWATRS